MIFERWIFAADRLGALAGGYVSNASLSEVALTLEACREGSLAESLRQDGPVVLARLPEEERRVLAEKVDPTLRASTRIFLQSEAIEMERVVGRDEPVRLVVAGRASAPQTLKKILNHEFRDQRGIGLLLMRPEPAVLKLLGQRHQLLWIEPASSPAPAKPEPRKKLTRLVPEGQKPPALFDLKFLARRHLRGEGFSGFSSREFFILHPGDQIRIGGLCLAAQDPSGEDEMLPGVDVLLAGGATLLHHGQPVAFAHEAEVTGAPKFQSLPEQVQVFLDEARALYATLDYDPHEKSMNVALKRSSNGHVVSRTKIRQRKEERLQSYLQKMSIVIQEGLAETIKPHLKGANRRKQARDQAWAVIAHVLPNVRRYLEWFEAHPESTGPERMEKLGLIEKAMMAELPVSSEKNDLVRRDLYKTFEAFLEAWGADYKI